MGGDHPLPARGCGIRPAVAPRDARTAVRSALGLFSALTDRIAAASPAELYERRVRLPAPAKAGVLLRSVAGAPRVARA
ncbi:hypothetical protein [Microbacterium sp. NIBRBAC000506063]|uniref:hypothetical protein n=1 Tax=Microbacterium sp. NIBRBAC000506063 TaxID=2734618 RepID=UPI002948C046|nr:hypothetical protein [Microbacterium sp. NIBRBAC000506063]